MSIGIIIQARMGSHRLPGKVLMDFHGNTLLGHIIARLSKLQHSARVIIATTTLLEDDNIAKYCKEVGVDCFRGSENNVLKRYVDCAKQYGFCHIVRMTGDNPFCDIEELDRLIEFHLEHGYDFTENFSTLPVGVGMEIFTLDALQKSLYMATLDKHFEHADEYILDNLNSFSHSTLTVCKEKNIPTVRLTVDYPEDYNKACWIFQHADGQYVDTRLAIQLEKRYHEDAVNI